MSTGMKIVFFVLIIGVIKGNCHYSGPFLIWGTDKLNNIQVPPALNSIDDDILKSLYSNASSIIIFLKNATTKLNYENFPRVSELIGRKDWLYLPQSNLISDPLEYNVNTEVITLSGPAHQQDIEIAALYRNNQLNYGNKNVLGILATKYDENLHKLYKREADGLTTDSSSTVVTPTDEPVTENLIYLARGKIMLYTTVAPVLRDNSSEERELKSHSIVTADVQKSPFKLFITFITNEGKLQLKFKFRVTADYWTMNEVEYDTTTLTIVGQAPSAPLGFSYRCSNKFIFRNGSSELRLENIQVEPQLKSDSKFSPAYDCVGFVTAPIVSGIFLTAIIMIVLSIAITAILDIKAPNRFENKSGKQLTFTVQE